MERGCLHSVGETMCDNYSYLSLHNVGVFDTPYTAWYKLGRPSYQDDVGGNSWLRSGYIW